MYTENVLGIISDTLKMLLVYFVMYLEMLIACCQIPWKLCQYVVKYLENDVHVCLYVIRYLEKADVMMSDTLV